MVATYPLLKGFRGSVPCEVAALEDGLLRVSAFTDRGTRLQSVCGPGERRNDTRRAHSCYCG